MPKIHGYTEGSWCYIRSRVAEQISTFQVTDEGVSFLNAHGLGPGDNIDATMLAHLVKLGYVHTGGAGPGHIEIAVIPHAEQLTKTREAVEQSERPDRTEQFRPKGTIMSYQPNCWLNNDLHRRIVAAARQFPEYNVLLRPTRRHIFLRNFRLPEDRFVSEFFRPCFAVLARASDPDKKPCLVIETEEPGVEMKGLYEEHGVVWVLIEQNQNRFVLTCKHGVREQDD
jgi:hypothetical protein